LTATDCKFGGDDVGGGGGDVFRVGEEGGGEVAAVVEGVGYFTVSGCGLQTV